MKQRMAGLTRRITGFVAALGLATLVVLSLIMMLDIGGRELFGMPITGFSDISDLVIVFAAAACFPASFASRQHVAVELLGSLNKYLKKVLDLLGQTLTLAVVVAITYQLGVYAFETLGSSQTTWLLYLPVWPVWMLVACVFALCVPIQLAQFIECVADILGLRAGHAGKDAKEQEVDK